MHGVLAIKKKLNKRSREILLPFQSRQTLWRNLCKHGQEPEGNFEVPFNAAIYKYI